MGNETLKKFSEELKSVREKKKLSLDKIFNKTRIDIKYLEAIEDGNFSIMPDVYIRAFLKEYATCIGLSPNETIEKYKLAQSGELYNQTEPEIVEETDEEKNKTGKTKEDKPAIKKNVEPEFISKEFEEPIKDVKSNSIKKTIFYFLSAVGMLAFIYFMYNTLLDETAQVEEKPFIEVLKSKEKDKEGTKTDVTDNPNREIINSKDITAKKIENVQTSNSVNKNLTSTIKHGKLSLTITATSRSWMRILIDDEKTNEFIIDYDIKKVLYANKKFYLHIGNSGGVKLLLNGKDLNLKGSEGRVRKIYVTKNGLEYIRRRDNFSNE